MAKRQRACREFPSRAIVISEALEQRRFFSVNLAVDAGKQFQTIAGFGTSLFSYTTTAPYDQPASSAPYQNFLNDYVNDLGASLLRIDFDPDVLPAMPATPLGTNLAANIAALNFQSPNASFYGGLASAITSADGGKLQVMATIWTPPAWMKANDSVAAVQQSNGSYADPLNHLLFQDNSPAHAGVQTNNLDSNNLTQFARYCAAYIAGMEQTYNINIVGLSIQNELLFNESYVSCSYNQDGSLNPTDIQYRRYAQAVKAVGEEFETDGLATTLVGPESVGPDSGNATIQQVDYIKAIDADTVVDQYGKTAAGYLGDYAIHGWGTDGTNAITGQQRWTQYLGDLNAEPFASRQSWQTEESGESQTWLGNTSTGAANPQRGALGMALQIHDTLAYGNVSAYYYLSTTSGHTTGPYTSDLMDSTDATTADPERTDLPQWKYLVFKHWSHFVEPGSVRVATTYTNASGAAIAEDPNGVNSEAYLDSSAATLTLEFTNESSSAQTVNISLRNVGIAAFNQGWLTDANDIWTGIGPVTVANGVATLTLPAYSVITLQGSTAVGGVTGSVYADDNGNGQRDAGEPGVAGKTIFLDLNGTGILAAGDPLTTTAQNGAYSFSDLAPGAYTAYVVSPGWQQTEPTTGGQSFTITAFGEDLDVDFGIKPVAPVASAGGPYTVAAGGSIHLDGSASFSPFGSIASYEWDVNYNGATFDPTETGVSPSFSAAGLNAPSSRTVALEVVGPNNAVSSLATANVSITDTPPTAAFTGSSVMPGQSATVTFTNVADPAPNVTAAGYMFSYDFNNDGIFDLVSTTATATVPASYLVGIGSHVIAGEITDINGGSSMFTTTVQVSSATSPQLTGKVIGTSGSFKNGGNTAAKAFDGNLATFFDGPTASGDWVGLDLGAADVITSIAYASRSGFASRMNGGIFQASNSSTFNSGVVNLYSIASNASPGSTSLTTQSVANSIAFRYVRYLAPANSYGDVAEVQFFGKAPTPPTKFTGTAIGTSGSYKSSGNTISKALDGNLSTFFDGPTASGDWVGLDLGSARQVKQIGFAPRSGYASRMIGGVFQASNTADFSSGVVNLYTVATAPVQNVLTTVSVSVAAGYRYVRYLGPANTDGDIAEVSFYG